MYMGKESFKNLYPVLQELASGRNNAIYMAISALNDTDDEGICEEARTVLTLLDNYEEPKLPFAYIIDEQIQKAIDYQKDTYGFVIWSNLLAGAPEDCAIRVKADPNHFSGMTENEVCNISIKANNEDKEIIKSELCKIKVNGVLIKGTVMLHIGTQSVTSMEQCLQNIFYLFTGYNSTLYIKDGQLQAENNHRNGMDHYTIYTFKEGVNPEEVDCQAIEHNMDDYVESLVPVLDKHFGWKLEESAS